MDDISTVGKVLPNVIGKFVVPGFSGKCSYPMAVARPFSATATMTTVRSNSSLEAIGNLDRAVDPIVMNLGRIKPFKCADEATMAVLKTLLHGDGWMT